MRFILIDKVVEIENGNRIKTVKSVSLAEEYLGDHFPAFPVLPGVLLLEGMIESASWLVRAKENFAHSMVLLGEARNVKYKSFAAPGKQVEYTVEAKTIEENISSFTGTGSSNGEAIVEAKNGEDGASGHNLDDEDAEEAWDIGEPAPDSDRFVFAVTVCEKIEWYESASSAKFCSGEESCDNKSPAATDTIPHTGPDAVRCAFFGTAHNDACTDLHSSECCGCLSEVHFSACDEKV